MTRKIKQIDTDLAAEADNSVFKTATAGAVDITSFEPAASKPLAIEP